ncbi:formate dehydrogenase accessory sulfurtransferase FdhD [Acidiferrimicrobium sp. IK]|uniref:formate dehydrogenase accessory sulfurtransferase FdhD n=1 Tax=Acidiferrimicrobium sp. IK TaxID=2871700 RepID=UPI0021CAE8D6|nr:formate dehydrogenase accessory sulfurtransferase FdhD [Acidiferrimicrobium sp. IK]MCU4184898.1 formate dehydrogenase accessory sulfurtransferase FdhD [Acidiferrimicrobium sp. IK]
MSRPQPAVTPVRAIAVRPDRHLELPEQLATEEPLEIRAAGPGQEPAAVAVTMRTPGHDFELAAGFLVTEALAEAGGIAAVGYCTTADPEQRWNTVTVSLRKPWTPPPARSFLTTSSCGVCGKSSIEQVELSCAALEPTGVFDSAIVASLPDRLRDHQRVFDRTGGLHAAGLFDPSGEVVVAHEDVGRHNAVDKVVGDLVLHPRDVRGEQALVVSGRVSFEIVQKAAMAGLGLLVAVSAPSSLAVHAATRLGVTVAGFVRGGKFNIYSHPERIAFSH